MIKNHIINNYIIKSSKLFLSYDSMTENDQAKYNKSAACMHHVPTKYTQCKVREMAKIRNQYNKVPHLTKDTTWESDKITIRHHKQEAEVSPFPAGDHKAAMNRRESMTNIRHK